MISIRCERGAGVREAPAIQDELITTEHLAVLRGKAFLDETHFHRTVRAIRIPYAAIADGQVVEVRVPEIASGKYLVRRADIVIEAGGKIVQTLELEGEHEAPA